MTGFEPRISGVGRDRSTNCATTTKIKLKIRKNKEARNGLTKIKIK